MHMSSTSAPSVPPKKSLHLRRPRSLAAAFTLNPTGIDGGLRLHFRSMLARRRSRRRDDQPVFRNHPDFPQRILEDQIAHGANALAGRTPFADVLKIDIMGILLLYFVQVCHSLLPSTS